MSDGDSTPAAIDDQTALNQSTYDRIAGRYVDNQRRRGSGNDRHFAELENEFLADLPGSGLMADLGCGPGLDAKRFSRRGFGVVGMDLSGAMLKIAETELPCKVAQADLRRFPVATGHIDAIWCAAALLHVPEQDTYQVLREFRRVVEIGSRSSQRRSNQAPDIQSCRSETPVYLRLRPTGQHSAI